MKDGKTLIALEDLCGIAEVSEIIGRSKGRVDQILLEDASFPRPVWSMRLGRIWDGQEIYAWADRNGYGNREVPEPKVQKTKPKADVPAPAPVPWPTDSERAARLDALLRRVA